MMEPTVSLSEDTALAEALTKLKALEKENSRLRSNCSSRSSGENCSAESSQELRRLKHHVEEVIYVVALWEFCCYCMKVNLLYSVFSYFIGIVGHKTHFSFDV